MRLIFILATIAGLLILFSRPNSKQVTAKARDLAPTFQVSNSDDYAPRKFEGAQDVDPVEVTAATLTVPEDKLLPTSVSLSDRFANLEALVDDAKAQILTASPPQFRFVTANKLNVRSKPSTSATIVSRLSYGARITVVSENPQSWLEISLSSGAKGWVFGKYVSADKPVSTNLTTATAPRERTISAPSSAEVRKATTVLIQQSIASYAGSCPCPYNRDRGGRRCGKRSAWSKPGGYSPICYDSDVTKGRLDSYFARLRGASN